MQVNACSACTLRHGTTNINQLNECCYNTCASFVEGNQSDIINSPCGQRCRKCISTAVGCKGKSTCEYLPEVPTIKLQSQLFSKCLKENEKPSDALKCCLAQCDNYEDQEKCIDSFNALIEVKEEFLFRDNRINRSFLFLVFVILFQLLYIYGPIQQLRKTPLSTIPIIITMYYLIHYL